MDWKLAAAVVAGISLTLLADMALKGNRVWWGVILYGAVAVPGLYALRTREFGTTLVAMGDELFSSLHVDSRLLVRGTLDTTKSDSVSSGSCCHHIGFKIESTG
jgi:hypothetical protein